MFTDEDFKWIDECDEGDDEDIEIYTYEPIDDDFTIYYIGDGTINTCWPGYLPNYFSFINFGSKAEELIFRQAMKMVAMSLGAHVEY